MAKRTYKRDARGRFAFAGGGGGGGKGGSKGGGGKPAAKAKPAKPASTGRGGPRGGKVGTRAEQARAKKAQQQRQATFASKATAGREAKARAKLARSQARATRRAGAASGIRRTGGLPTVKPASNIRPTTGPRRAPLGGARNAIRTFNPTTNRAKADQMRRQIDRIGREIKSSRDKIKGGANKLMEAKRRFDRGTARDLVDSKKPGLTGEMARLTLSFASPRMVRGAQNVIRSRAARARAVAERGGKAGKRALEIYGNQLAFTGAGKTPRGAKNKIVPGPRSTQPPAKPKRRAKAKTLGDIVGISTPAAKAPAKPRATAKPKPAAKPKAKPAAKPAAKPKATAKPKAPEKGGAIIKRPSSAIVRQQPPAPAPAPAPRPSAQNRPGSITSTLRGMLGSLAKLDAARAREIENITGKPIPVPKRTAKPRIPGGSTGSGSVTGTMRGAMRGLAQSDARFIREVQSMTGPSAPKSLGGKGGKSKGSLPASKPSKPRKPKPRKPKPKP